MPSDEKNIEKRQNRTSTEMTQTNSRLDFSSRVMNSLYKIHEFIMNWISPESYKELFV